MQPSGEAQHAFSLPTTYPLLSPFVSSLLLLPLPPFPFSRCKHTPSPYTTLPVENNATLVYYTYVHPFTRVKLQDVTPILLDFKGNYGVAVNWSDGHFADIFPFDILREIGENLEKDKSG
jgi:Gamma-butyrobetaine hydroxylase-like, N-terminal